MHADREVRAWAVIGETSGRKTDPAPYLRRPDPAKIISWPFPNKNPKRDGYTQWPPVKKEAKARNGGELVRQVNSCEEVLAEEEIVL